MKSSSTMIAIWLSDGFVKGLDCPTILPAEVADLLNQGNYTDEEYVLRIGKAIGRCSRCETLDMIAELNFENENLKNEVIHLIEIRRPPLKEMNETLDAMLVVLDHIDDMNTEMRATYDELNEKRAKLAKKD